MADRATPLQTEIRETERRLAELRRQRARFGYHTPPHINMEIEDAEADLTRLRTELAALTVEEAAPEPLRLELPPLPPLVDLFGPPPAASPLWSTAVEGWRPVGPPMPVGGELWLPTLQAAFAPGHSALHRFDRATGRLIETRRFEGLLIAGMTPGGAVLFLSLYSAEALRKEGTLLALDVAGRELWRWQPGVTSLSVPAVSGDGTVWVATGDHRLVGLDPADGRPQAIRPLPHSPAWTAAPLLTPETAYIPCRGPHLVAVSLLPAAEDDDGFGWTFRAEDHPDAWFNRTPCLIGDRLVAVLNPAGLVAALHPADGRLLWRVEMGPGPSGGTLTAPATDGQRLYLGSRAGLHALDPTDGREAWSFPVERGLEAGPVVAGGVLYIAGRNRRLYALDPATGRELWPPQAVERRLEVPPLITGGDDPLAVLADRGGTITALRRPLSPAEAEAAGQWLEAAAGYLHRGQTERAARLLSDQAEPLRAGQVWESLDRLDRAVEQYQLAGAWERAAALWLRLDRPLQAAAALQGHARALPDVAGQAEAKAVAWERAARLFEAGGDEEQALLCRREVIRHRRLPDLVVALDPPPLVLEQWSRLRFTVHNQGHGPARQVVIRVEERERFEGQVAETRRINRLSAGQTRQERLDIRPLQSGESVPLRITLEYQDRTGAAHTHSTTLYLQVAADRHQQAQISGVGSIAQGREARSGAATGGGIVILGDIKGDVNLGDLGRQGE